ncbi:MAG TPA: pirin family protein [Myxococcales bacterium]|jgi:redox-sensitive bicupin YhaK (pirin superfamily)|nr:pirin family protein [Myxococcales bacterium]
MIRSVHSVLPSVRTQEGGGFWVRRPFPTHVVDQVDPFLLLDQMGPTEVQPGEAKGAPDHPHRGFETVTYMLAGESEHRDSAGHSGVLGPGDVQWMTAGDGVVHAEMPSKRFQASGGRMLGFQLWVNLPRRDKRMRPRYQELKAASIPSARSADGKVQVRVIAGEALGARAAVDTRTPIFYLHYSLQPGARVVQPAGREFNTFAWIVSGEGRFGEHQVGEGHAVVFDRDGDEIAFEAGTAMEVLLIGGVPLDEPVVRYGPFVMNEDHELLEAMRDYQTGRMGSIPAEQIGDTIRN